ncbi:hypothetical protein PU560_04565 [Georgenia sp. 10Sc9-8]|uniref:Peptidase n=1 Tax=Georgenia halotolerans TaxID=3028317 RepID=A0ABT5TUL6_9MICO|nr:hypothetical protein [Georgenia halotolerans]
MAALLTAFVLVLLATSPVAADEDPAGRLLLDSQPEDAVFTGLDPGSVAHWQVGIDVISPPSEPHLSLALEVRGPLSELPGSSKVSAQWCAEPWDVTEVACPADAHEVLPATPAEHLRPGRIPLGPAFEPGWVLVTVSVPGTAPAAAQHKKVTVRLHAVASGEEAAPPPAPERPAGPPGSEEPPGTAAPPASEEPPATAAPPASEEPPATAVPPATEAPTPEGPLPSTGVDIVGLVALAVAAVGSGWAMAAVARHRGRAGSRP